MSDDPVPEHRPPSSEEQALIIIASAMADYGMEPDLSDDCALVSPTSRLISTDTIVEGRHFDCARDSMAEIGRQAAVCSLSDLAASGGIPSWVVWSLCLPKSWTAADIRELSSGFSAVVAQSGAQLVGGNLTRTAGPAVINITVAGTLAGRQPFLRRGAQPDDIVFLSGEIGDAILGVVEDDAETRQARHRWRPHLDEALKLSAWGKVTAAMDVSDGLLKDAGRLAEASGLAIDIQSASIPLSTLYRSRRLDNPALALSGGEDYVLLFTASPDEPPPIKAHPIGRCLEGHGIYIDGQASQRSGYDHFSGDVVG